MQFKIRHATVSDMPAVYGLMYELAIYENAPESVQTTVEEYTRDFENGAFRCQVAEMDGRVVGMILYFMMYSSWRGRMLYLDDFVVTQQYRRFGIGQALFEAFVAEARAEGVRVAKWQVLDWNTPAIQFYEKNLAQIEKDWWNVKMLFE